MDTTQKIKGVKRDPQKSFLDGLKICLHCLEHQTCPHCGGIVEDEIQYFSDLMDVTFACENCGPIGGFTSPMK